VGEIDRESWELTGREELKMQFSEVLLEKMKFTDIRNSTEKAISQGKIVSLLVLCDAVKNEPRRS